MDATVTHVNEAYRLHLPNSHPVRFLSVPPYPSSIFRSHLGNSATKRRTEHRPQKCLRSFLTAFNSILRFSFRLREPVSSANFWKLRAAVCTTTIQERFHDIEIGFDWRLMRSPSEANHGHGERQKPCGPWFSERQRTPILSTCYGKPLAFSFRPELAGRLFRSIEYLTLILIPSRPSTFISTGSGPGCRWFAFFCISILPQYRFVRFAGENIRLDDGLSEGKSVGWEAVENPNF